jgi:hypothetical protein
MKDIMELYSEPDQHEEEFPHLPLACIFQRFGAGLVDVIFLLCIATALSIFLSIHGAFEKLFMIYQITMHTAKWKASFGERLMGIRPVYFVETKQGLFIFRYFLLFLPILATEVAVTLAIVGAHNNETIVLIMCAIVFILLWFSPMFLTKRKVALHDLLSNTRMVQGRL